MLHAVIQRTHPAGRKPPHGDSHGIDRRTESGRRTDHRPPLRLQPHLNATLSTASLILLTITSASSVPCLPLKPFIAATIPTISRETSRIRPTYSTVPCPASPAASLWMRRTRATIRACRRPI